MAGYLINYLVGMGFLPWMIFVMIAIMLWDMVWKLLAMWKAARKGSVAWFVALLLFNTAGILPILYIYAFSEMKKQKAVRKSKRKKKR